MKRSPQRSCGDGKKTQRKICPRGENMIECDFLVALALLKRAEKIIFLGAWDILLYYLQIV
jgi:hypothetical protein